MEYDKKEGVVMKCFSKKPILPDFFLRFLIWSLAGLAMGILGGCVGAAFSHTLSWVTALRKANPWLVWLLPLGGILTVALYRLPGLRGNRGTNAVIASVEQDSPLSPQIAPGIFLATSLTHLLGGSAGREGAALQLGGSMANSIARLLRWKDGQRVLTLCGMSAVFAALFGTPVTAAVFTLEFTRVGTILTPALLPCYLAAFTAAKLAAALGVPPETLLLPQLAGLNASLWLKILILAAVIALLGAVQCRLFHGGEHLAARALPNPWLRVAAGGSAVALLTLLVGDMRYNGAGMDMALLAVEGQAQWYDFLLKLLFTTLTLAAGFKGGEIVPTFCMGATLGCVLGGTLGLEPGIAAALGLVELFCCVTNSPLAALFLSVELFGSANLGLFGVVCAIGFVLSGHCGLYDSQIQDFSRREMRKL